MNETSERLYQFIRQYIGEHGYAPSFREMAAGIGTSSTHVVHYNIQKIVAAGLITQEPDISRGIVLVEDKNQ